MLLLSDIYCLWVSQWMEIKLVVLAFPFSLHAHYKCRYELLSCDVRGWCIHEVASATAFMICGMADQHIGCLGCSKTGSLIFW